MGRSLYNQLFYFYLLIVSVYRQLLSDTRGYECQTLTNAFPYVIANPVPVSLCPSYPVETHKSRGQLHIAAHNNVLKNQLEMRSTRP